MVLAITDDDQGVGFFVRFFKGFDGELNGSSEVGSTGGDDVGVQLADGLMNRGMVDGQWCHGNGSTRKGDHSDAIIGEGLHQLERHGFGMTDAVRGNVFDEH